MAVIIDHEELDVASLNVKTLGDVLEQVRGKGRMVVQILVDGQEPDLADMVSLRQMSIADKTFFLETATACDLANDAIVSLKGSIEDINELRLKAIVHFDENQPQLALQSLAALFTTWHAAHLCINRIAELGRMDLETVTAGNGSVADVLRSFTTTLRELRSALQNRDFVLLGDMLRYDLEDAAGKWLAVVQAVGQSPWLKAA